MGALSSLFGYILNFIYNLVSNYGLSIILFSLLIKIVLLPISIKQQKTMIKTAKIQEKVKEIQKKYSRKDGEKLNAEEQMKINNEMMALYKKENISPFSGCLSTIIQLFLLIAVFGLVRSPLTHMKKVDVDTINNYKTEMKETVGENTSSYPEISILKYVNEYKGEEDPLYINMNFLGLDLNKIPRDNLNDYTVYIIPILYVITSVISMKISTKISNKKENEDAIIEIEKVEKTENQEIKENKKDEEQLDMSEQMNKNMSLFMPLMAVAVAVVAPLGLALYWLLNNILMIVERLIVNKVISTKKEA